MARILAVQVDGTEIRLGHRVVYQCSPPLPCWVIALVPAAEHEYGGTGVLAEVRLDDGTSLLVKAERLRLGG